MANARFVLEDESIQDESPGKTDRAAMNRAQTAAIQAADAAPDHYALAPTLKRTSGRATGPVGTPIANTPTRSGKASTPKASRPSKPIPTVPLS